MTVSTIASIAAGLTRTLGEQGATPNAALNAVLQQASPKQVLPTDTSPASAAISLQNQVAPFRVASQDVAQAGSAASTAELGADEISRHLGRLQDIALQASSSNLTPQQRAQLNSEFQALRARIDAIANSSSFNNQPGLSGGTPQQGGVAVNLTDDALFQGAELDVSTGQGAKIAGDAVKAASADAQAQIEGLKTLQSGLGQVAGGLQTAIQNQEAANSTLDDAEITAELFGPATSGASVIAGNANIAIIAQTNRLPTNLLQLIDE